MVVNTHRGTKNPAILGSSSSSILHVTEGLTVNTAGIFNVKKLYNLFQSVAEQLLCTKCQNIKTMELMGL
jgi:hypothetical protein